MRNRFAAARQACGFTPNELSARIQVSVEELLAWESGATSPTLAQLVAMVNVLGLPVDFLLCRDEFVTLHDPKPAFSKTNANEAS